MLPDTKLRLASQPTFDDRRNLPAEALCEDLIQSIPFSDDLKADEFEKYLKSGSGRAFANKHLL